MIHLTFAAAMAQRMGLPSGRGSRKVSAYRLVDYGVFTGSPRGSHEPFRPFVGLRGGIVIP